MNKRKFNDVQELEIVRGYSDKTLLELSEEYGVSRWLVRETLIRRGVGRRSKGTSNLNGNNGRQYTVDYRYFDEIDTPEKADFLGWLYSDGSNKRSGDRYMVVLQLTNTGGELDLLYRMRDILYPNHDRPLYFIPKKNAYSLVVYNKHLCNTLIEKGIVINKSLSLRFPGFLREDLLSHFVRGIFGGDGYIGLNYRTLQDGRVSINAIVGISSGSKLFLNVVESVVRERLGINCRVRVGNGCYGFFVGGNRQVLKFLDWIYKDAVFVLQRKYDKYLELREYVSKYGRKEYDRRRG